MIKEYTFQSLGEESNYRQFPDEIENNNLHVEFEPIFLHCNHEISYHPTH